MFVWKHNNVYAFVYWGMEYKAYIFIPGVEYDKAKAIQPLRTITVEDDYVCVHFNGVMDNSADLAGLPGNKGGELPGSVRTSTTRLHNEVCDFINALLKDL